MSWGLNNPCWNCQKASECSDAKHISDAINAIHQDTEGHKGSGVVVMSCAKCAAK